MGMNVRCAVKITIFNLILFGLQGCGTLEGSIDRSIRSFFINNPEARELSHNEIVQNYGGAIVAQDLSEYLNKIATNLVHESGGSGPPVEVLLLDSSALEVVSSPGYVFLTRGMMMLAQNDSEIAGIIAHQMAHQIAGHKYEQSHLDDVSFASAVFQQWAPISTVQNIGRSKIVPKITELYSKQQEEKALEISSALMATAGYEPTSIVTFANRISLWAALNDVGALDGAPASNQKFSHFSVARTVDGGRGDTSVVAVVSQEDTSAETGRLEQLLHGMEVGENPANSGFIQQYTFINPDAGFSFAVPNGFSMQNVSGDIFANAPSISSRMFFFQIKTGASPHEFLDTVFATELGVELAPISDGRVTRREAAVGAGKFTSKADEALDVTVYAVQWDSKVLYLFVWTAPSGQARNLQRGFQSSVRSLKEIDRAQIKIPIRPSVKTKPVLDGENIQTFVGLMSEEIASEAHFRILNDLGPEDKLSVGQTVRVIN